MGVAALFFTKGILVCCEQIFFCGGMLSFFFCSYCLKTRFNPDILSKKKTPVLSELTISSHPEYQTYSALPPLPYCTSLYL